MNINGLSYYIALEYCFLTLKPLWDFLENIIKYGNDIYSFDLEGPVQILYVYEIEGTDSLRVAYATDCYYEEECVTDNEVTMKYVYNDHHSLIFDIIVDKNKFVYEFYKELFTMFYNKETPDYHEFNDEEIIKESPFLRGYFGDLLDEEIALSVNPKTRDYPSIRVNYHGKYVVD